MSNHYAKIDFEKGNLGFYTEIAVADGFLKGYVKTLLEDSKLIGKEDQFLETIWVWVANPIFHVSKIGKFVEIINLALKCIVLIIFETNKINPSLKII